MTYEQMKEAIEGDTQTAAKVRRHVARAAVFAYLTETGEPETDQLAGSEWAAAELISEILLAYRDEVSDEAQQEVLADALKWMMADGSGPRLNEKLEG